LFRQIIVPKPRRIIIPKPIAPIVPMPAKLRLPRNGLDFPFVRPNPEIMASQICHRPIRERLPHQRIDSADSSAAIAVRSIEPIIESILESIGSMLLVSFHESREQGPVDVGFP